MTIHQALQLAMQRHQSGRLAEAESLYRQVLDQQPNYPDALHLLGAVVFQSGRPDAGLDLIRRAIALHPTAPAYHSNLGHILSATKRVDEAAVAYGRAAELQPTDAQAQCNFASALYAARRLDDAVAAYRHALKLQPNLFEAWSNLGNVLRDKGDLPQALDCCKKALTLRPDFPEAIAVLAGVLRNLGRADESIAEYKKAIALRPDAPEFHNNLALALRDRGRLDEALLEFEKSLTLQPDAAQTWSNKASILRDQGHLDQAVAACQRAIKLDPNLAVAHLNLGTALLDAGRIEPAVDSARRALALRPDLVDAHNLLANALKEDGSVPEAIDHFDLALSLSPNDRTIFSNKLYVLEFHPDRDAKSIFQEQRRWNHLHAAPLKSSIPAHDRHRAADRPLRIGYVSPYFYSHAESFFVVPLLEAHDRRQFQIHCYSDAGRPDAVTHRLRACADVWRESRGQTDAELADQIRHDGIDILIDLTMHMAYNRALVFARKPAPVQVAWLAYPGGTGLDTMDFRITDSLIDPPDSDESCYREKSIRLPDCWCCYDPLSEIPAAPARAPGPIRFGSLNNPCKLNEQILRIWAQAMQNLPDSRLLLQAVGVDHRKRILDLYQSLGIAPDRLEFVARTGRPEYLRLYDRIDIALDPLPYNGITTTCDALWMGVPVVTLPGQTAAGRAGASILITAGLPEFAAQDAAHFARIATDLANDLPRLANLRSTLRNRLRQSPLMDFPRFARNMESAYRRIWLEGNDDPSPAT